MLGTAQNLDIAEESWDKALRFCDPDEGRFGEDEVFAIPALKARTKPPVRKNGQKAVRLKNGAQYQVRAANRRGGRGKAADRVVMDELREQNTWDTWSATAKANSAKFNSQLWGISNAGDNSSVVLSEQRENLLQAVNDWDSKVVPGLLSVEDWAKQHSITHALFEWSAPDGCAVDDVDGILQANPSIGYSHLRVEKLLTDSRTEPEHIFRTESLCQWVEAMVEPYLPRDSWSECADSGSEISPGSRLMFAIDISEDRQMTYVAVAGYRDDGLIHGEVIAARAGSLWVIDFLHRLAEAQNCWDVALQPRGAPVSEFVAPLHDAGFRVVEVGGSVGLGGCCGGMHDLVFQGQFKHLDQPVLNMAADFAVARHLGEVRVWDRKGSLVDIASLVAVAEAVWALEHAAPATVDHEPPPAAEVVRAGDRMDAVSAGVDFRSVSF
ncbi:terminase [Leucobacter sp. OH1287]|uniref:terminase n=1 Tax=Leucobacter sp. OH1287 TaxID=2491049 RepID=UPI000F5E6F3F|nr:terminase [Leucobacter sp. OH1287]RRD61640.1 terminase [Leucobacter sp. OH1287]